MEYKVGQVLYFVGTESVRVIPALVVEEVVRTTIEGKEKNYIVQLPDDKMTKLDMTKLKGESFSSIKKLKSHMIKSAEDAIHRMIDSAVVMSEKAFDVTIQQEEATLEEKLTIEQKGENLNLNADILQEEVLSVDMGNGLVGKVNIGDLNKVGA